MFFFFKQKTAYDVRISDWSSDVCSSDLIARAQNIGEVPLQTALALMLREKLTGEPIPAPAVPGVELVRAFIEERVGGDMEALALSQGDQAAFQALSLDMLEHLDLTHPSDAPDQGEDEENEDGEDEDQGEEDQEQGEGDPQAAEMAGETDEGDEEGAADDEPTSDQDMGEGERKRAGKGKRRSVRGNAG